MAILVFILFRIYAQFVFEIRYPTKQNILKKRLKTKKGQTEFDRVPTLIKT
jgi:hypothetical protein